MWDFRGQSKFGDSLRLDVFDVGFERGQEGF